jgi:gliding motility-associated-like protein
MKVIIKTILISFIFITQSFGQSIPCPNVDAGIDQTFDCSQSCTDLSATYLDIRATTSYTVEAVPHSPPISYTQTGGTTVFPLNTDDIWSNVINLPFTFCFFGQQYNQLLIGTNGNLNFNLANAGGSCPWNFSTGTTPTNPNCPSAALVPMGNIFGVYHDVDPSKGNPEGTVKYYVSGQAPCRIFTVVYNNLAHFGSCDANTFRSTFMMVLYETTNYIDIYVERKDLCTAWNGGNAVIGIQNSSGTQGYVAPGRNTSPDWSLTTPEAWRFKPAGNPLYTFQWLQGTTSLGSTQTINVCPIQATTYTAEFVYTPCGSTTPITLTDDVTVTPAPGAIQVTSVIDPSLCGQSNGSVTLSASGGSGNFQYSSDDVTFSSVNSFSGLSSGQYIFYVQDDNGCHLTYPVTVNDLSSLSASFGTINNISCAGGANGSVEIIASGGTPTYSFVIGTGNAQTTGVFSGLTQGNYVFTVTDSEGCSVQLDTSLTQPPVLNLTQLSTNTTSCNLPNGALSVTATGGTGILNYSIDGFVTQQVSGLFDSLYSNSYFLTVQDANGCQDTLTVYVPADSSVQASLISANNISCFGLNDGDLSVGADVGPLPYTYSLNNGPAQSNSVFSNLTAGQYTVLVTDANGCKDSVVVNMLEPPALVITTTEPSTICAGDTISLLADISGGIAPYVSVWNGNITGNPISVTPTTTTNYNLLVTDSSGCTATDQVTATVLSAPIANAVFTPQTGYAPLSVVFSNQSSNANVFDWNFGNGQLVSTIDLSSVNTNYTVEGTYFIQLIASNGLCTDIWLDSIVVEPYVILEVEVPNVFSPNSDGTNEGYYVYTKNATGIEAVIVDRWGVKMVEITDLNYKWDGKTPSGKEATDGVYFLTYKVTGIDNQEKTGHTFFHLIR